MSLPTFLLMTIRLVLYLDFVQSWLEAIRYKGVAIYLFFNTFSMSCPETTLKKRPSYVILHMTHICGMYKVESTARYLRSGTPFLQECLLWRSLRQRSKRHSSSRTISFSGCSPNP